MLKLPPNVSFRTRSSKVISKFLNQAIEPQLGKTHPKPLCKAAAHSSKGRFRHHGSAAQAELLSRWQSCLPIHAHPHLCDNTRCQVCEITALHIHVKIQRFLQTPVCLTSGRRDFPHGIFRLPAVTPSVFHTRSTGNPDLIAS